ncbi:MAG: hypothetical protein WC371_02505 [Parachlamydiales bacterium]|jgi:hypothetical protein
MGKVLTSASPVGSRPEDLFSGFKNINENPTSTKTAALALATFLGGSSIAALALLSGAAPGIILSSSVVVLGFSYISALFALVVSGNNLYLEKTQKRQKEFEARKAVLKDEQEKNRRIKLARKKVRIIVIRIVIQKVKNQLETLREKRNPFASPDSESYKELEAQITLKEALLDYFEKQLAS